MEIKTVKESTYEERAKLYDTIMENIKPLDFDENGNVITASARIPLELLFIDMRYQRIHKDKGVKNLYENWDVRKLAPLSLAPRDEDKCFDVIDGGNRSTVANMLGIPSLTSTIMMQAPKDDKERLRFECEIFRTQNTESENVRLVEKHPANVIIGDKAATIIEKLAKEYDVPIDNNASERAIRGFCVGKKNWQMIDTINGARTSAMIYSIAETSKANNLKPYDYFEYLLEEIPKHMEDTDRSFLEDLLPWSENLPAHIRK